MPNAVMVDSYALSPLQQGMLFHWLVDPHSGTDVEHIVADLNEAIDPRRFETAWRENCTRPASQLALTSPWLTRRSRTWRRDGSPMADHSSSSGGVVMAGHRFARTVSRRPRKSPQPSWCSAA